MVDTKRLLAMNSGKDRVISFSSCGGDASVMVLCIVMQYNFCARPSRGGRVGANPQKKKEFHS